jgi:hypothetical protein
MRPVTQYLKPEVKDSELEAAAILPPPVQMAKDDSAKPKINDIPAIAKDQIDVEKNGEVKLISAATSTPADQEDDLRNGGPLEKAAPGIDGGRLGGCGCCLLGRNCFICKIFLMINWRLLLDCNFIVIALGRVGQNGLWW